MKPLDTVAGRLLGTVAVVMGAAAMLFAPAPATAELKPVTIRIASDIVPPPHPAALAMEHFKKRLPEVIPGSEVRVFYAGSLYTIPEAMEAMAEGNLEMSWGQFGKSAASDRWMNLVAGPMLVTTPGAMEKLDEFESIKALKTRFDKTHNIKVFGTAHMSMFMGAGGSKRLRKPEDFSGKKIRSMGPAENAALEAWGASPVVMAFGDVPPALQTGVIDGLLTSLGGFNSVRDQAPYYTIAGINGITGDYYWVGASNIWWNRLNKETQAAVEKLLVEEIIPLQKQLNWCNDQRLIERFGTDDPEKPGIYMLKPEESKLLADRLGDATVKWVKANTPAEAHQWVDKFVEEAKAASAAEPLGSSWLEKSDCGQFSHYFKN